MVNVQKPLSPHLAKKDPCSHIASHQYFTALLGGLVSNAVNMREVQHVLDIGCSEGGWVLDMARQYLHIHVTGIDSDEQILREAARQARFHGISNVTFLQQDATGSLPFKLRTFDLIHARSAKFLYTSERANVIEELLRVLRPGGWLNLVEFERSATSSIAFDRLMHLFLQMIQLSTPTSAGTASPVGIAADLYGLLMNAYLLDVSYSVHAVDFNAYNTLGARAFLDEVFLALRNVKAPVCRLNALTPAAYDTLLARAYEDLQRPDACGFGYLISATGRKDG